MTTIHIIRTDQQMPDEKALEGARALLFGAFDGWSELDKKAWRRWWKRIIGMEPGEMARVDTVIPRSGPFHRRHMAIERAFFDAQERFTDFDMFTYWLKVGAGWVTWAAGPKGGVVPVPNSISYGKADEDEFREFHGKVVDFLRGPHAAKYLWPHLDASRGAEMVESILIGFNE